MSAQTASSKEQTLDIQILETKYHKVIQKISYKHYTATLLPDKCTIIAKMQMLIKYFQINLRLFVSVW